MVHGPAEELAYKVAEAATDLLKAFAAESAIGKRRGNFDRAEFVRARCATQECAEAYANAMREYVQFFQRTALEEGHPQMLNRALRDSG